MHFYHIAGLSVVAEMELPGAIAVAAAPAEVTIRFASVPSRLPSPTDGGPIWQVDAENFLLCLPGIGRFLATGGHSLSIDPAPDTDPRDSLIFALGTGIGALLHQRGVMVLHASAVARKGRAYAFCGASGIGKSTLAAALCQGGHGFLSDDISAIGLGNDGRPILWPDGRQLKLFDASLEALGGALTRGAAVRPEIPKYYVDPPAPGLPQALPLAAIYFLAQDQRLPEPTFEPLRGLDAAGALHRKSYRRRLALAMARSGNPAGSNPLAITTAILRHVPVILVTRPSGMESLPRLVAALERHWAGLDSEARDAVPA